MVQFKVNSLAELDIVVQEIKKLIEDKNFTKFLFSGAMGTGKTTLIKAITSDIYGIQDACSPTFSIINTYLSKNKEEIYHIDCYRIEEEHEIENLGLIEIINEDSICFIEWPKKIHNFLPMNCVKVVIELENNLRTISITT